MSHHRISRSAALGLALAAFAVPAAAAQQQDLRSPDARDAARAAQTPQDLRSPDTRDLAEGRGSSSVPKVLIVKAPQPSSSAGGIDWGDAGIGAGGLLGLILLGLGGTFAVMHRRRSATARRPTASTG